MAVLNELGVDYEATVVSAHRTPENLLTTQKQLSKRGLV